MNPLNSVSNFRSAVNNGLSTKSTNRLTKRAFIRGYLSGFSQDAYRPHYSDHFIFDKTSLTGSYGKDAFFWEMARGGAV